MVFGGGSQLHTRGLGAGVEKACREPIREIDLVLGALIGRYGVEASGWMQMSECRTFPRCEWREPSDELPICRLHYFPSTSTSNSFLFAYIASLLVDYVRLLNFEGL